MSYLRGGCGVNRMDGKSNENVYKKFSMSSREGMSYGVVEMKRSTGGSVNVPFASAELRLLISRSAKVTSVQAVCVCVCLCVCVCV